MHSFIKHVFVAVGLLLVVFAILVADSAVVFAVALVFSVWDFAAASVAATVARHGCCQAWYRI